MPKGSNLSDKTKARIAQLAGHGLTHAVIAARLGLSVRTVGNVLK